LSSQLEDQTDGAKRGPKEGSDSARFWTQTTISTVGMLISLGAVVITVLLTVHVLQDEQTFSESQRLRERETRLFDEKRRLLRDLVDQGVGVRTQERLLDSTRFMIELTLGQMRGGHEPSEDRIQWLFQRVREDIEAHSGAMGRFNATLHSIALLYGPSVIRAVQDLQMYMSGASSPDARSIEEPTAVGSDPSEPSADDAEPDNLLDVLDAEYPSRLSIGRLQELTQALVESMWIGLLERSPTSDQITQ